MPISRFQKIISRDMAVITELRLPVDQVLLADFNQAIAEETARIKDRMMQSMVGFVREGELRKYVRTCQYTVVKLSARLLTYTNVDNLADESRSAFTETDMLCHALFRCLCDLLLFIERHFGQYVWWTAWVPQEYLKITRHMVAVKLKIIEQKLDAAGVGAELRGFVCDPLRDFLQPNEYTYGSVRYLMNLQNRVLEILPVSSSVPAGASPEESLHRVLVELNYNTSAFFHYHTEKVERTMALQPTVAEKLNVLKAEARRLHLLPQTGNARFTHTHHNLADMMRGWIREETDHQVQLNSVSDSPAEPRTAESKTELGISVAVLAAGIRALVATHTFPDENVTQLGRTLSECFTTLRSGGSFSVATFRQNYYNMTQHSRQAALDIFQKAIQWLKKN